MKKIKPSGTIYISARVVPSTPDLHGSETLLSIPNVELALHNAGSWIIPLLTFPGDAEQFGDLAAYAFAFDESDAARKIDALTDLLACNEIEASEVTFEARAVAEYAGRLVARLTVHCIPRRSAAQTTRPNVAPFMRRAI